MRFSPRGLCGLVVAAMVSLAAMSAAAQHDALEAASKLSAEGRHAAAEAVYDRVLAGNAGNVAARIGRGFTRAWQKNYEGAEADFRSALAQDPGNVAARNGLGYTLAWAGRHEAAEAEFKRTLQAVPDDFDAAKGLAYVALWRDDAAVAVVRFRVLTEAHPENAEMFVGLGQAHLAAGDKAAARTAFEQALALEPARADARSGLEVAAAPAQAPGFGITAYYGSTRFADGVTEYGFRFAEVAMQVMPSLRLWVQYDQGLARDNIDFVRRNINADAVYVGGLYSYGAGHSTRFDVGRRKLDAGDRQNLLRIEQALRFDNAVTPKLGIWLGDSDDASTEYVVNGGVSFPVTPALRIEPMIFYAENSAEERELRALLFGEYTFAGGTTLGIGLSDGRKYDAPTSDAPHEIYVAFGVPIGSRWRLGLLARRESGAGTSPTELIALGGSYSF